VTIVLAAVAADVCAQPVLRTAIALTELFDASAIAFHVRENATSSPQALATAAGIELRETAGDATDQIVAATRDPDVAALVLGARAVHGGPHPAGQTALDVITRVPKPVAVVPPHAHIPQQLARILMPLEGTSESSLALENTVKLAHQHKLEILVLHVHAPATLPAFSNHEHERVSLVHRLGVAADDVVAVARETAAELIVLAWSQDLSPGHARIVSETLAHSDVPVLLMPAA